ncbi:MAG: FRG domain-containing protein [candidate division NC10 bacterium]|nr:FRG domain-containing protein [candidate division NC10 bacterium]
MKERNISCWEDFEREIGEIFHQYQSRCQGSRTFLHYPPLFRGQRKSSWPLTTTLERYTGQPYTMRGYWELIRNYVKCPVESVTEKRWDIGDYPEEDLSPFAHPGYEFMVYLRHHGFPSPLLDWTESPYVAAFFALRSFVDVNRQEDSEAEAAIYHYEELPEGSKNWGKYEPHIRGLGPNIVTTPRHFRQQSWYTVCRVLQEGNGEYGYASHEEVFRKGDTNQDVLTKIRIPASKQNEFLDRLSLMNINAYTLFGNEEGLMEALAYKAIVTKSL